MSVHPSAMLSLPGSNICGVDVHWTALLTQHFSLHFQVNGHICLFVSSQFRMLASSQCDAPLLSSPVRPLRNLQQFVFPLPGNIRSHYLFSTSPISRRCHGGEKKLALAVLVSIAFITDTKKTMQQCYNGGL